MIQLYVKASRTFFRLERFTTHSLLWSSMFSVLGPPKFCNVILAKTNFNSIMVTVAESMSRDDESPNPSIGWQPRYRISFRRLPFQKSPSPPHPVPFHCRPTRIQRKMLWSESFWLPNNETWESAASKYRLVYPKSWDFIPVIPIAFGFLVARFFLQRCVLSGKANHGFLLRICKGRKESM